MPGIEPGAFHMQSERATTALHPLDIRCMKRIKQIKNVKVRLKIPSMHVFSTMWCFLRTLRLVVATNEKPS